MIAATKSPPSTPPVLATTSFCSFVTAKGLFSAVGGLNGDDSAGLDPPNATLTATGLGLSPNLLGAALGMGGMPAAAAPPPPNLLGAALGMGGMAAADLVAAAGLGLSPNLLGAALGMGGMPAAASPIAGLLATGVTVGSAARAVPSIGFVVVAPNDILAAPKPPVLGVDPNREPPKAGDDASDTAAPNPAPKEMEGPAVLPRLKGETGIGLPDSLGGPGLPNSELPPNTLPGVDDAVPNPPPAEGDWPAGEPKRLPPA